MGASLVVMFASVIYLPLEYSFVGLGLGVMVMIIGLFGSEQFAKYSASGFDAWKATMEPANKVVSLFLHKGIPVSYPVSWWDERTQGVVPYSKVYEKGGWVDLVPLEFETLLSCKARKHPVYGKYTQFFLRTIGAYSDCFPQESFQPSKVTYNGVSCDHNNVAPCVLAEVDVPRDMGYNVYVPVYQALWTPNEYIDWQKEHRKAKQRKLIERLGVLRTKNPSKAQEEQDDARPNTTPRQE